MIGCSAPPRENGDLEARWNTHFQKGETGDGMCAATTVDKSCRADPDCAIVEDILDECRTTAHLGISAKAAATWKPYDPCEHKRCPLCNIRWQFAEDCGPLQGAPVVACVSGRCLTRSPEK